MLAVDGEHHHSVASSVFVHGTAVAADEQDIFDVRVKHHGGRQFNGGIVHAVGGLLQFFVGFHILHGEGILTCLCVADKIHAVEQYAESAAQQHHKHQQQAEGGNAGFLPAAHGAKVAGTGAAGFFLSVIDLGGIVAGDLRHKVFHLAHDGTTLVRFAPDDGSAGAAAVVTVAEIPPTAVTFFHCLGKGIDERRFFPLCQFAVGASGKTAGGCLTEAGGAAVGEQGGTVVLLWLIVITLVGFKGDAPVGFFPKPCFAVFGERIVQRRVFHPPTLLAQVAAALGTAADAAFDIDMGRGGGVHLTLLLGFFRTAAGKAGFIAAWDRTVHSAVSFHDNGRGSMRDNLPHI